MNLASLNPVPEPIVTNNYMVVNKVTHTFRGDEHMMELDLIGGEFIA